MGLHPGLISRERISGIVSLLAGRWTYIQGDYIRELISGGPVPGIKILLGDKWAYIRGGLYPRGLISEQEPINRSLYLH